MNILISACLTGVNCRYDGKNKNQIDISELNKYHKLFPICPEVDGGLDIPRAPAEIQNDRVINAEGKDVTAEYRLGAEIGLKTALKNNCEAAVLKAKSPSCGKGEIYDGSFTGKLTPGDGVLARLLTEHGIKIYTENEIETLLN